MEHLSQTSQDLLNNPNPAEILDQQEFLPLWQPDVYRWINGDDTETTEEFTSSPIQINRGLKRQRSITRPDIEIEPTFKQLKIDTVWHKPYVTEMHTHPLFGNRFPIQAPNKHFFPRFLAQRLPLPEYLISSIFNTFLNPFDRQIITGEHVLLTQFKQILNHRRDLSYAGISRASPNSWFLSTYNVVDEDPNSPHPEVPSM